MSTSDKKAGRIVGLIGDFALGLGGVLGGEGSLALLGVGAIARSLSKLIGEGESVDEVLKRLRPTPRLVKPWRETPGDPYEDTAKETPHSKKDEPA
jgi:hypothetical protein